MPTERLQRKKCPFKSVADKIVQVCNYLEFWFTGSELNGVITKEPNLTCNSSYLTRSHNFIVRPADNNWSSVGPKAMAKTPLLSAFHLLNIGKYRCTVPFSEYLELYLLN